MGMNLSLLIGTILSKLLMRYTQRLSLIKITNEVTVGHLVGVCSKIYEHWANESVNIYFLVRTRLVERRESSRKVLKIHALAPMI